MRLGGHALNLDGMGGPRQRLPARWNPDAPPVAPCAWLCAV